MKALRLYGAGLLVALLLTLVACSTGGPSTTVTVKQLRDGSSLVYYRVGSGSWQSLTLSGGQGTFTATGEYEVAARCDDGNILYLFKASTSYRNQVTFFCRLSPGTRDVEFTVTLPSSVGGMSPQNGDMVFVGRNLRAYNGTDPVTVNAWDLKTGAGSVVITLHRPLSSSLGTPTTTPYGYKVVNLGPSDTSVTVDGRGWQAFTATRSLSASMPAGFDQGGAGVFHFRDAYLFPAVVGLVGPSEGSSVTSQYGLLPSGGVYVGSYVATKSGPGSSDTLAVIRDTGGNNWNATPPTPWASGQFSVSGNTLTFTRGDAKAFTVELWNLAQRTGGIPLRLKIFVQAASGGNTTYRIPVVPGLDYELINNPGTVLFVLQALVRDRGADLFDNLIFSTEAELSGIDLAIAEKRGIYSGSSYTLP